jgi:hypothetical protein
MSSDHPDPATTAHLIRWEIGETEQGLRGRSSPQPRLGDYFAEVLLLDQGTFAAKARDQLGWSPTHPGLVDEFRHGSYARAVRAA